MIECKHITKIYQNEVHAVDNLSFSIQQKQFVVVAGPSGCGKTTLLYMIAGLTDITSGELYFNGSLMNQISPQDRNIAMVFQDASLFHHMNVYDNITFGLHKLGWSAEKMRKEAMKVARMLSIEELLPRRAGTLSGGQKQRTAIARAIIRQPQLFLMDEPLSALDHQLKAQLRKEIMSLYHKLDVPFLYVTHDQREAMTMADVVLLMKDGKLEQAGSPMELYRNPDSIFVASYLGSERMNFLTGQGKNKDITIGIRPGHLIIEDESVQGIQGKIQRIEELGDEWYLYIQTAYGELAVRQNHLYEKKKQMVSLTYKKENLLYFSSEDGKRIRNIDL